MSLEKFPLYNLFLVKLCEGQGTHKSFFVELKSVKNYLSDRVTKFGIQRTGYDLTMTLLKSTETCSRITKSYKKTFFWGKFFLCRNQNLPSGFIILYDMDTPLYPENFCGGGFKKFFICFLGIFHVEHSIFMLFY